MCGDLLKNSYQVLLIFFIFSSVSCTRSICFDMHVFLLALFLPFFTMYFTEVMYFLYFLACGVFFFVLFPFAFTYEKNSDNWLQKLCFLL